MLKAILDGLIDLVYPPACLICKHPIPNHNGPPVLCGPCSASIQPNVPPFCPICSRSLVEHPGQTRCQICRDHPPAFDFAWSACWYTDPLRSLIHDFKFNDRTLLRHVFVPQMVRFIHEYNLDIAQFDRLVPIPLSPTRLRERTYNQAELLAQGLSRAFDIPLALSLITRQRHTAPHSTLKAKERFTNIRGAFKINLQACCRTRISDGNLKELLSRDSTYRRKFIHFATGPTTISIKDKNILLIDDLLTTGATASEAARVLKSAGANTVGVFTLAITP